MIQLINIIKHIKAQNMKPVDIKSSKKINDKEPKFKIGDIVRISKYKTIFAKGYTSN